MKHATPDSLDRISTLLEEIRSVDGLKEKTRGVFYLKSRAFLHFHEDGDTMYADVRLDGPDFDRFRVKTSAEHRRLLIAIRKQLRGR